MRDDFRSAGVMRGVRRCADCDGDITASIGVSNGEAGIFVSCRCGYDYSGVTLRADGARRRVGAGAARREKRAA
jgi:hypothetical protein